MAARILFAFLLATTPLAATPAASIPAASVHAAPIPAAVATVPDGGHSPSVPVSAPASRSAERRSVYSWPTGGEAAVLRPFEPPPVRWAAGHRGVDLCLPPGSPVFAAADGTVAFAGTVADRPLVSIDHADGIRTTHEPVVPAVSAGRSVRRGDLIGTLGAGHCETGCLHFGARTGPERYLDPLLLLRVTVVRLLPW